MKDHASPSRACQSFMERLSSYVDGELHASSRRSLEAHLARCPCCEELAESLKRTVHVCHELGSGRLPRSVRSQMRARVVALLSSSQAARCSEGAAGSEAGQPCPKTASARRRPGL